MANANSSAFSTCDAMTFVNQFLHDDPDDAHTSSYNGQDPTNMIGPGQYYSSIPPLFPELCIGEESPQKSQAQAPQRDILETPDSCYLEPEYQDPLRSLPQGSFSDVCSHEIIPAQELLEFSESSHPSGHETELSFHNKVKLCGSVEDGEIEQRSLESVQPPFTVHADQVTQILLPGTIEKRKNICKVTEQARERKRLSGRLPLSSLENVYDFSDRTLLYGDTPTTGTVSGRKFDNCHTAQKLMSDKENIQEHQAEQNIGTKYYARVAGECQNDEVIGNSPLRSILTSRRTLERKIHLDKKVPLVSSEPGRSRKCAPECHRRETTLDGCVSPHCLIEDNTGSSIECPDCAATLSSTENLRRHSRVHCSNSSWGCFFCGGKFRNKKSCYSHMERLHRDKYKNHFRSKSAKELKTDSKVRNKELARSDSYTCGICGKSLKAKNSFERHLQIVHLKIAPFECTHCMQRFSNKNNMDVHILKVHKKS